MCLLGKVLCGTKEVDGCILSAFFCGYYKKNYLFVNFIFLFDISVIEKSFVLLCRWISKLFSWFVKKQKKLFAFYDFCNCKKCYSAWKMWWHTSKSFKNVFLIKNLFIKTKNRHSLILKKSFLLLARVFYPLWLMV